MQSSRFIQICPWCSKSLHIPVEYLGKPVGCKFCQGRFTASYGDNTTESISDSGLDLLRRADEVLERAQQRGGQTRQ